LYSNFSEKQILDELKTMVDIGGVTFKADLFSWQESGRKDQDVVDYDRENHDHHHL